MAHLGVVVVSLVQAEGLIENFHLAAQSLLPSQGIAVHHRTWDCQWGWLLE